LTPGAPALEAASRPWSVLQNVFSGKAGQLARGKDPFHSVLAPSTVLTNHLLVKLLRQCPVCEELCDLLCRRPVLTAVLAPWPRALAPVSKRNPLSHSLSFSVFLLSLSLSLSLLPSLAFSHSIPAERGLAELLVSRSWRFLAKRKRTYRLLLTVFDTVWRGNVLTSYCVCAQFGEGTYLPLSVFVHSLTQ
jgi:hypothetical protein